MNYIWNIIKQGLFPCNMEGCPGSMDELRVFPERGGAYPNHILMCDSCKRIIP